MLRAAWRDTMALWREFRVPFMLFVLASIAGGYLYGELHVMAGYERIPYSDLPYIMVALMVLETPIDLPREWYLIAFWYVLPPLFLYIVGRGAIDFVRLFFNRSERRNAWEEAVASTYRNHVIVLGVGHVGLRIARTLARMGFEIVAIDLNVTPEKDDELSGLGIPAIVGDGRLPTTLEKAGLLNARALIVCTSNDHVNLEVTMRVRDMNPNIRIVVRMWDDQFAAQLKRFMGVEAVLSASDLAAPVFAGVAVGVEITQTMHINNVDYSMIRLHVEPNSFLEGETVGKLQDDNNMDIVLHGRDGKVEVQPDNNMVVRGGDTLVIFARHDKVIHIVERNRNGAK
jgi:Trk K+ transport system NAD-binding subunit